MKTMESRDLMALIAATLKQVTKGITLDGIQCFSITKHMKSRDFYSQIWPGSWMNTRLMDSGLMQLQASSTNIMVLELGSQETTQSTLASRLILRV